MSPRERLLAALRHDPVDRVPFTLLELNPYAGGWRRKDPSYARVLEKARELQDNLVFIPVEDPNFTYYMMAFRDDQDPAELAGLGDLGVFLSAAPEARREVRERKEGDSFFYDASIHAPAGELRGRFRVDPGVMTSWVIEPFIKSEEDLRRLLSIPFEAPRVDVTALRGLQERLGESGLLYISMLDPIGLLGANASYEELLVICWRNEELVLDVLRMFQERLKHVVSEAARGLSGAVFRFCGAEFVTPPMLSREHFRKLVTELDREIFSLIRDEGTNFSCLHCHGRIRPVLDEILAMHPDLLEPIEPPPDGDVSLEELFETFRGRVALMGRVEGSLLEMGTPEEIENALRDILATAKRERGFILAPSAAPFVSPLPESIETNLIHYLETARRLGAM